MLSFFRSTCQLIVKCPVSKVVFFFSHSIQIKWYATFAEIFKNYFTDCKIHLFVHGETDQQCASHFKQYDEVINILDGFIFNEKLHLQNICFSNDIKELENKLNQSFFWEDVTIDRWIRAKQSPSYSIQYLNHAFNLINQRYQQYRPICGFGESGMAIYRLAHHLFDRDGRYFLTPIITRYFDRFYIEMDWDFRWRAMFDCYQHYVKNGIPNHHQKIAEEKYNALVEYHCKPAAVGFLSKRCEKNSNFAHWFNIKKYFNAVRNLYAVNKNEVKCNVRYCTTPDTVIKKMKVYWFHKKSHQFLNRYFKKSIPNNITFCVYFLHYRPEYIIDSLGRYYQDQEYLIANIAANLPSNYFLLIKEHPAMKGYRPISLYQKIKNISNATLIHPDVDSHTLISQSQLVFTIAGTTALEAVFLNKQSIVFGQFAYSHVHLVSFCDSFWKLNALIRKKLAHQPDPVETKKHALCLLAAKYQQSFPGKLPYTGDLTDLYMNDAENQHNIKTSFEKIVSILFCDEKK